MASIKCPNCGQESEEGTAYCSNCGKALTVNTGDAITSGTVQTDGVQNHSETVYSGGNQAYTAQGTSEETAGTKIPGKYIASFVLGICSLVFVVSGGWLGIPCGIVGIVLGKDADHGLGKAGKIMSIIGVAICGAAVVLSLSALSCAGCLLGNLV